MPMNQIFREFNRDYNWWKSYVKPQKSLTDLLGSIEVSGPYIESSDKFKNEYLESANSAVELLYSIFTNPSTKKFFVDIFKRDPHCNRGEAFSEDIVSPKFRSAVLERIKPHFTDKAKTGQVIKNLGLIEQYCEFSTVADAERLKNFYQNSWELMCYVFYNILGYRN